MKYLYSITIYLVFYLITFQVELNSQDFTIAVIPDPQYYTDNAYCKSEDLYNRTTQWIVDNKNLYNIKFVANMGDLTNDNETAQWVVAKDAHLILRNNNIPFSVVPGNHDYGSENPATRNTVNFQNYFGSTYFNPPWYTGTHTGGIANTYNTFEVGNLKFLILNLEYAARTDIICWANNVYKVFLIEES